MARRAVLSVSSKGEALNDRQRHGGDTGRERLIAPSPIGSSPRLPGRRSPQKSVTIAPAAQEPNWCFEEINDEKNWFDARSLAVRDANVRCRGAEDARGDLSHRAGAAHGVSRSDREIRRGES